MVKQFRKKPVVVEAVQLDNLNASDITRWIGKDKAKLNLESDTAYQAGKAPPMFSVTIKTLEGDMKAMPGDYIIRGVNGEFYPCKPDIFAKTYEPVPDLPTPCISCPITSEEKASCCGCKERALWDMTHRQPIE